MSPPDAAFVTAWAKAFIATQLIEVPIYLRFCVPGRPWVALGASTVTHPLLWLLLWPAWQVVEPWSVSHARWLADPEAQRWFVTGAGELAVWCVEAAWFTAWRGRQPWRWTLVANGVSAGVGVVLWTFWRWP